jgi:2'-hydroxyisoflavone reductase
MMRNREVACSWRLPVPRPHRGGRRPRPRLGGGHLQPPRDACGRRGLGQIGAREWDVVVDTWAGAPRAVRDSARALAGRADRYVYVSSGSVYRPPPPIGGDESSPTVDSSSDAEDGDYPELKRGAELAVEQEFGDRALIARAGLILGPREDVGRLPWWLLRMDRGGDVLCPAPPDLPLQYVDARDLARWMLDGATGTFNAVGPPGHATMGTLLEACRAATGGRARLVWADPGFVQDQGVEPWQDLPIWIPDGHEYRGMHAANVDRALAAGLSVRPVEETVRDTWEWLLAVDKRPALREDLPPVGLDPDRERAILGAWRS